MILPDLLGLGHLLDFDIHSILSSLIYLAQVYGTRHLLRV